TSGYSEDRIERLKTLIELHEGQPAVKPNTAIFHLRQLGFEPNRQLVGMVTRALYPYDLTEAVRETRTTVLVIEPGSTTDGRPTFYFTVIICRGGKVEKHPAMRLWVSLERQCYLVPDPDGGDAD